MSQAILGEWLQKDVRKRKKEYLPRVGKEIELASLTWDEQKMLTKEHTVVLGGGKTKFNQEEYTTAWMAAHIVAIDGQPINLRDKKTLKENGLKDTNEAISRMFTIAEINRVLEIINEISGASEEEEVEKVEELKN
ncbi:phage tail assembly chaperone [Bacillus badius]|uniref:Phage protein n=1 Tax=Bacillus badius TaxID=1455 RepID=A0ABR5AXX4_BACBA|nr:hypothetical protein [Bacillus badius]KIL79595.1 hypothetical protein SD77_2049 [Bacillus badius]MED4716290.1 hypothetical protein [Bacillus badius]UAT29407.1 hypothetical protein K7T73_12430 [Bacillus badius]